MEILGTVIVCVSVFGYFGEVHGGKAGILSSTKFMTAQEAKTFHKNHRVKRGWWLGERSEEGKEQAGEINEDLREVSRMNQELTCRRVCWKDWSAWGKCEGKCNTGVRRRTRSKQVPSNCNGVPCPGPSEETQKCLINCGAGGEPRLDKCHCRIGWKDECCQNRIPCPRPPNPANGHIVGSPATKTYYNDVIIYQCKDGYGRIGPEQRKCQTNGKWTGADTKCERVVCPSVPSPPNGKLINVKLSGIYYAGETVGYSCQVGYELHGVSNRVCEADSGKDGEWSAPEPICRAKTCGDPGTPRNSKRSGIRFTYGEKVNFECNRGYQLIGSKERECLETGTWSGTQPICQQILCDVPERPQYGEMIGKGSGVDTTIDFTCHRGYELIGDHRITCLTNGSWSGEMQECKAIGCGDPGKPESGTRHDQGFRLGNVVNFTCYEGYILDGPKDTTCMSSKKWSNTVPKCVACPRGYFKTGPGNGGICQRCPSNSHTATVASSSQTHCVCDHGYGGPPGGPCVAVQCPTLTPPPNGKVLNCKTGLGDTCIYDCIDGSILQKGSTVRSCTAQSTWDGDEPQCISCPKNTYKASPGSCLPCPRNAFTTGPGQIRSGCKCAQGYVGPNGGPCTDSNECATPDGLGPCDQECNNFDGGFICKCTIPGNKIQADGLTCYAARFCQNLTTEDSPDNGGLVCHNYAINNAKHCTVKCNPGYELPARTNAFETCGPTTGFIWSFRTLDRPGQVSTLIPCIEEFFPGFRFEGDSAYFVRACDELDNLEQEEVKREFANLLTDNGVCIKNKRQVCDFRNVAIICGKTRRKRGAEWEEVETVDIKFNITAKQDEKKTKDCNKICQMLRIPARYCDRYCLRAYKRFLKAAVQYAKIQVDQLYKFGRDNLTFRAAAREFEPQNKSAVVSEIETDCDPGLESVKGMCVPCLPGQYYSLMKKICTECPVGEYQTKPLTTSCMVCPSGETTNSTGSRSCTACPEGKFGLKCSRQCSCVHGRCDKITGDCFCDGGWEGPACDNDINDCEYNSCFKHVNCLDTTAPGRGFTCGPCPNGFQGNGMICTKLLSG